MGSKGRRFKRCNPASTLNRKHLKYRGRYASFQNPDYVTPPFTAAAKAFFLFGSGFSLRFLQRLSKGMLSF